MKKLIFSILAGAALAVSAQTSTNIFADVLTGIGSLTNYSVSPYITYGLDNKKFGGGLLALYNVNSYVGAGLGADYLGQFSIVSADVKLQVPIRLSSIGLSNIVATPFALTGIGTPLSGAGNANGNVSTYAGVGAYIDFASILSGRIGLGGAYGARTGAESYSGKYVNMFLMWHKGF